jgi:ATP-dependent RNA helicase SUPV3L1/SUV3
MARGVAFQLAESVGVIERQKIAEEVKGLDQPSRATLRKYGVRFGAYHIYLPILLKPAPRVLATQLWALKHESPETKGLDAIERLAASGRTSIAADKEAPRVLYRTAGYRVCGERAVRVDILERLADIVRPALAWRGNSPGQKPAAAFDGSGFVVTVAMTSLTGCSGEEFASILRALGYRMEKRPKPAAAPAVTVTSEAVTSEAVTSETGTTEPVPADTAAVSSEMPGVAADPTFAADGATDVAPHGELASAQMPAVNPVPGDTATAEIISQEPTPTAPTPVAPAAWWSSA